MFCAILTYFALWGFSFACTSENDFDIKILPVEKKDKNLFIAISTYGGKSIDFNKTSFRRNFLYFSKIYYKNKDGNIEQTGAFFPREKILFIKDEWASLNDGDIISLPGLASDLIKSLTRNIQNSVFNLEDIEEIELRCAFKNLIKDCSTNHTIGCMLNKDAIQMLYRNYTDFVSSMNDMELLKFNSNLNIKR